MCRSGHPRIPLYSDCPGTIRTTCTPPPQSGLLYPIRTKKARCFQEKVPANRGSEGSGGTGERGKRWGTLERVPQTPQNFSRINLLLGRRLCRFQRRQHLKQSPPQDEPVPPGFKPRGCKGRSPLHKITINLPLPRRGRALCERGRGDRGQENQLKAVATSAAEQADTANKPQKNKKKTLTRLQSKLPTIKPIKPSSQNSSPTEKKEEKRRKRNSNE